jgi:hypothetical protein
MGDKSPKSFHKLASQKQVKAQHNQEKKQQELAAKQASDPHAKK